MNEPKIKITGEHFPYVIEYDSPNTIEGYLIAILENLGKPYAVVSTIDKENPKIAYTYDEILQHAIELSKTGKKIMLSKPPPLTRIEPGYYQVTLYNEADIDRINLPELPEKVYKIYSAASDEHGELSLTKIQTLDIKKEDIIDTIRIMNKKMDTLPYLEYIRVYVIEVEPPKPQEENIAFDGSINCVLKLCLMFTKLNKTIVERRIYGKHPEFKNENPGADRKICDSFCRSAEISADVFTPLGHFLGIPWYKLGDDKRKKIKITMLKDHALIARKWVKPNSAVITRDVNLLTLQDVCDHGNNWVISWNNGDPVIYKSFRPSEIMKVDDDDYPEVTSAHVLLYKMLVEEYDLKPTSAYRKEVKKSEQFMGRNILIPKPGSYVSIDHNKHYSAYTTSPYYQGFPTHLLTCVPAKYINDENVAFVFISNLQFHNPIAMKAYNMLPSTNVIPTPMYRFLQKYATMDVTAVLITDKFQKINMLKFVRKNAVNPDGPETKLMTNGAIGAFISGGIKEEHTKTFYGSKTEVKQMAYECYMNGLKYDECHTKNVFISGYEKSDSNEDCITARYKKTTQDAEGVYITGYEKSDNDEKFKPQYFKISEHRITVRYKKTTQTSMNHIHSYLLTYANIATMEKYIELQDIDVYGYTVDSLWISPADIHKVKNLGTKPGQWKIESKLKTIDSDKSISLDYNPLVKPYDIAPIDLPIEFLKQSVTVIHGAAGVGKTHMFLGSKSDSIILLEPTIELRDAKKNKNIEVATYQHYFLPFHPRRDVLRKTKRVIYPIVVVDEYFCISPEELEIIIQTTLQDGSTLILLGDDAQLKKNYNGERTHEEVLLQYLPMVHAITRTPESPARHDYDTGVFLDSLRYLSTARLYDKSKDKLNTIELGKLCKIDPRKYQIVSGNHKRISQLNRTIRDAIIKKEKRIHVRHKKDKSIHLVDINSDKIWWDKNTYDEEFPIDKEYLPMFAETIDSVQGRTITDKKIIVDIDHLNRPGAAYTAITRTNKLRDTLFLSSYIEEEIFDIPL